MRRVVGSPETVLVISQEMRGKFLALRSGYFELVKIDTLNAGIGGVPFEAVVLSVYLTVGRVASLVEQVVALLALRAFIVDVEG